MRVRKVYLSLTEESLYIYYIGFYTIGGFESPP
jgi:hypothetical protein